MLDEDGPPNLSKKGFDPFNNEVKQNAGTVGIH